MTGWDVEVRASAAAIDRRAFLRLVGMAAGAGLVPAGCGGVPDDLAPAPATTLEALSPRTYAVFTAAAMRIIGPRGAALVADRTIDVGRLADAWLVRTPTVAAPLGQALLLLEFGIWPLLAKSRPFTALAPDSQDDILSECMASRLDLKRAILRGIRALTFVTFYGSTASRPLTNYPGPFGMGSVTIADAMRE